MSSVAVEGGVIHLGLDVHKNSISVGVLEPGEEIPRTDKISSDDDAVRRLVARFDDPRRLRVCYEAGPTGYELARLLRSMGVRCQVVARSLIPTAPGDRVKTDKRDCRRLARLHRAGELVAIRVPTVAEEAVRDLCRARADMVIDQTRARHRLSKFLLRHGRVWRGGDNWTGKHQAWIAAQRFADPALTATFAHYRATLTAREAAVVSIEADLAQWFTRPPFADAVARLGAYRGITQLGALTLASEVCDWRRFPTAGAFMGWSPRSTPAASGPAVGTSPTQGMCTCAPSWSSRRGPTSPAHRSEPDRPPPRRAAAGGDRPGLGRAAAADRPIPSPGCPEN
jgi:transposase